MNVNNYNKLVNGLSKYITPSANFVGPSLYFHQKALEYQQKEFLSERHIEYVYATLVAWGMHRMGTKGAKMPDYDIFKSSIFDSKIKKALEELKDKRIEDVTADEIDSIIEKLSKICFSVKGSDSKSHLVSGSKILAHILPNLVCPMDRQYTCKFFGVNLNSKNEQTFFKEVIHQMWKFYQDPNQIRLLKPILGKPFNMSFPKIFDNLIINYVKAHPHLFKK